MVPRPLRLVVLVAALAALPAGAASAASYHSPGYTGTKKPIKTAPAPGPGLLPAVTVGQGNHPSVVVDAAGTAHIAWTTDDGNQADALHYCRLPRGATKCDNVDPVLRPEHPYVAGGDGPEVNVESGGPKLFIVGDQLVMVTHRSATYFVHPDGGASPENETTLIYTSPDGGTTWTGPAVVGTAPIQGVGAVFGTASTPTIVTISDTVTGGTFVQGISPAAFSSASANLGTGSQQWFGGSVAIDGNLPVAAFSDGDHIFMQRWTGNGSINNAATWTPQVTLPGDTPQLAGGPSGLYLSDSESSEGDVIVHRITGASEGPGTKISNDDPNDVRFLEGPDGRLLALWDYRGSDTEGIYLNTAPGGTGWAKDGTEIQKNGTGGVINEVNGGVAADGGGFAVAHEGEGTSTESAIVAVPFGSQAATGKLGVGGLTGGSGGDSTATEGCKQITFEAVSINVPVGCFTRGLGDNAIKDVATGTITLNGLTITPDDAGAVSRSAATRAGSGATPTQIIIDPRHHTLDTTGNVKVTLENPGLQNGKDVVLWHGQLHIDLPANAKAGTQLFDFPTSEFKTDLEGFPILGDIPVYLSSGGGTTVGSSTHMITVKLPSELGGVTATAVLVTKPDGLSLASLKVTATDVPLGPVTINEFDLEYTSADDLWTNVDIASVSEPFDVKLTIVVKIQDGSFHSADLTIVKYPGYLIYEPFDLYLTGVDAHIAFGKDGTTIAGGATLGAEQLPPQTFLLGVHGEVSFTFGHPFSLDVNGQGFIVGTGVLNTDFLFQTSGTAVFSATLQLGDSLDGHRDPPPFGPTGLEGNITAGILKGSLDGHAQVEGCLAGLCTPNLDLEANDKGAALCVGGGGILHDWNSFDVKIELSGCDDSAYKPASQSRATRVLGAPASFTVPAGAPNVDVEVDGPTAVTLAGPSGPIALAAVSDTTAPAVAMTRGKTIYIGLRHPAAGTYTVTPAAASPPIAALQTAVGHDTPKVTSARVTGSGRKRTLTYAVTEVPGVQVSFVERGKQGDYPIGVATGATGHITFRPATGTGGPRDIVAVALPDGAQEPRQIAVVAHYTAPGPPKPGRVRRVTARHAGTSLAISFSSGANAVAYLVKVSLSHGLRYQRVLKATKHSVRVPHIAATLTGSVTVTTIAATGAHAVSRPASISVHAKHRAKKHHSLL